MRKPEYGSEYGNSIKVKNKLIYKREAIRVLHNDAKRTLPEGYVYEIREIPDMFLMGRGICLVWYSLINEEFQWQEPTGELKKWEKKIDYYLVGRFIIQ